MHSAELSRDVVVVGAGPSGVSTSVALRDAGLDPLVIDRADSVASAWRSRYDRLRLNTCRPFSHMPGRPFPRGTPLFPNRDQLVAYFERHAEEAKLDLRLETKVDRIDRVDHAWALETSDGTITAPQVVISTGFENAPVIPPWDGRAGFAGRILHSSEYRNAEPFQGTRVLVVGPGCSGMEIAYDLAEGGAAKVWLSARTPPNILLRQGGGGIPGDMIGVALLRFPSAVGDAVARIGRRMDIGDLTEHGLPVPKEGVFNRLRRLGAAPAIVDREVIEAIRERRIEIVRGVDGFDGGAVVLADGARIEPEAIVCATGYRRGLEPLVGHLGVLDEHGLPKALAAEPAAHGMRFVGYVPRPGGLGYMGKEGRRVAKAIARELGTGRAPR